VIDPYAAGAVVPNDEIFPALKRGMLEMGFSVPGYWKTDIPIFQVGSLPFAFQSYWEVMYFYKTLGFDKMLADQIAKHGVLYWDNRVAAAELVSKKPINSVNDLKGMKLRANAVTSKFFSLIGAQPVVVAGPEIYTGLSMGVINGAHWGPAFSADSLGLYEVAKYHMKPSIYMGTEEGFFVNKKALDKLPQDIQVIVQDVLANEFWLRSLDSAFNADESLARVQKKHSVQVIELPKKDQQILYQAAQKVWEEVGNINAENAKAVNMLKKFLKDIGRIE
jgi:TRAP-type C4-dicarboxylate transport system substrate-binding protein